MALDDEALPSPASGLFLEVLFRRLLASCEEICKGDTKAREDLRDWQTSIVFHQVRTTWRLESLSQNGCS